MFQKISGVGKFSAWEGEGYHDFPSIVFGRTVPDNFVEETCAVLQKISGRENVYGWYGAGSNTVYRWNLFICMPENFVQEPFLVSETFWYRNFSCMRRAVSRFFVVIFKFKNVGKNWVSNHTSRFTTLLTYPLCHRNHWNFWQKSVKFWKILHDRDSNPDLPLQILVVLPQCNGNHWIGISDKCWWNHENIWHKRDPNPDLELQNPVVLTPLLSFNFE